MGCVQLKKNEVEVLGQLVDDCQIADIDISKKLDITTQAVGKIRKRLENKIIQKYSVDMNLEAIGINVMAVVTIKVNDDNWDLADQIFNDSDHENLIKLFNVYSGNINRVCVFGFRDFVALDAYFQSLKVRQSKLIDVVDMFIFSSKGVLFNSDRRAMKWALKDGDEFFSKKAYKVGKFPSTKVDIRENERLILESLVDNAKISSTDVAKKIGITARGVCKIKTRLKEKGMINAFVTDVDYSNIGLKAFLSLVISKRGDAKSNFIQMLLNKSNNLMSLYEMGNGLSNYYCQFGFKDLGQLAEFMEIIEPMLRKSFDINESFIFNEKAVKFNSTEKLYKKAILSLLGEIGSSQLVEKKIGLQLET